MIKFNVKNILLATTALCAVTVFANGAKATYTPTRGDDAAYTVTAGTAGDYNFKEYIGLDVDNNPIYQYYRYTVKTDIEKVTTRASSASVINTNNGKPYIGANLINSDWEVLGGAVYNTSAIPTLTGDFISNYVKSISSYTVDAWGGAIYNTSTIPTLTGDFIGNYAYKSGKAGSGNGGAIYNKKGTIGTLNGNFIANHTEYQGGAIYNTGTMTVNGNFFGNYVTTNSTNMDAVGGAIYNSNSSSNITINGDFIGNYVSATNGTIADAGAIYISSCNDASIVGNFIGNYAVSNNTASAGAVMTGNSAHISNLTGDFINNYVKSTSASSTSGTIGGGALWTSSGSIIESLSGDFIGNHVDTIGNYAYGGAYYTNNGTITLMTSNFIGNYVYANPTSNTKNVYGGAIMVSVGKNITTITGDFIDNYAYTKSGTAYGGAISVLSGKLGFVADAGNAAYEDDILFKGNYTQVGTGAKKYEAIYASDSTMTFTSRNNGSYTFYDYIVGTTNSTVTSNFVAESGTGVLNLYNDIKSQTNVNFTGDWNIDMRSASNDETTNNPYNSITAKNMTFEAGKIYSTAIDVNFAENKADTFNATTSGSGIITLDNINALDTALPTSTTTVRVLYTTTNDLQLALGSAYVGADPFYIGPGVEEEIDPVTTPLNWSSVLYHTTKTYDAYGQYALATTSTTNDSISLVVTKQNESSSVVSQGDTLALLARSTDVTETKNFNADPAPEAESITYTLGDDIGAMKGTLNINGSTTVSSTVDLNNHAGFTLGDGATALNLNDVTITGNTTIANVTAAGKSINLHNAVLDGNISGTKTYDVAVAGNTEFKGYVSNADVALNGGELKVATNSLTASALTINGGDFNIRDNASTTVNALTLADDTALDIDSKELRVNGKATFGAGTTLSLKVNDVTSDFGSLKADEIVIDPTAKLQATLAQGLVDIGKTATIQLLSATNSTDFNKFNDSAIANNNMYYFTKNGLNGAYDIKQVKTAEDVVNENGGSENNAQTASAWVDGDSFEKGSVEAEVADKLSALAQHDPEGFKSALTTLAPEKDDIIQRIEDKRSERLMTSVNQRLAGTTGGQISMASGDELDKGLSVWADIYHSRADMETTRKVDGFDVKANGAIFGMEKEFAEHKKIGVGYQREEATVHGRNRKIEATGNNAFVYGEYAINAWRFSTTAMYDFAKYKETKYTLGDSYTAKYDVNTFLAQQLIGYDFVIADGNLVPQAGARYKHMRRESYTDGAGQKVSAADTETVSAVLGVNFAKEFEVKEYRFTPEVYLGAVYDLKSDKDNAMISLANGSSYSIKGNRLHRFGTEFNANVKVDLDDNWSLRVQYSGELREDYQSSSVSLGLRYNF